MIYNEIYNEPKLKELQAELYISEKAKEFNELTKDDFIVAQNNLHNYIHTNNSEYLDIYNTSLTNLISNLKNIVNIADDSDLLNLYLKQSNKDNLSINVINQKIDSIKIMQSDFMIKPNNQIFKLKSLTYDDILDSINVETSVSVDSVKRKGLLSRVGNAIVGKVDVQKEKSNVVLTLTKGSNVSSGDLKEQINSLLKSTDEYYQKEFANYKKQRNIQQNTAKKNSDNFFERNKELLNYSNNLLNTYRNALFLYTNDARNKFQDQYYLNKKIRNYSIVGVIILMVVISIILIFISKLTFTYEKKLVRAKKRIQQNLKFKDRIMGMISHEIRSPLNIISIYTRSIRKQIDDIEIKETLKSIEFTTHSLSLLANQILAFSKNEYSRLKLNKSSFNLKYQLDEILKALTSIAESKGNKLIFKNEVKEKVTVYSDIVKIHQLFYNLIGNSNKFTTNGVIEVSIDFEELDINNNRLVVLVKDNGIGIQKEDLESIFKSYYQGEVSDNIKNIGAGLGLNLCKEIVELFNGTIKVTSIPNVETIVMFDIYLEKSTKLD